VLGQAVAYNSSYSSRVEERDGLATQLGNKTECALLGLLNDLDIDWAELRKKVPEDDLLKVFPFNSAKKRMSTVITVSGGRRLLVKGAAEVVLEACSSLVTSEGEVEDLDQAEKDRLQEEVVRPMAEQSLRAICLAYRDLDPSLSTETEDDDELATCLTCLAVVGIEDPVRHEVPAAIQQCQAAGITVRMVTGDNLTTARAIAVKCGIIRPGDGFLTIEGEEFNRRVRGPDGEVQQELLDSVWPDLRVLARSKPRDKFTLVRGIIHSQLAANREVVAVTGDGTNDAPALKEADVGFAMGIAGTDVAKVAASSFFIIVNAFKQGFLSY
jgi:Ca2+ transporting ATPase